MMKHLLIALAMLLCGGQLAAQSPPAVRTEIETLLTQLQASGCRFNRNGSWYTGAEAKAHLLTKLQAIEQRKPVLSAEQFIELAASTSSASGKPYQVQCGTAQPVPSQQWLVQQLASVRGMDARAKP